MKIVIAPDSFKGSLTAAQACEAIAAGTALAAPKAEIVCVPMADGGEGTVQSLIDGLGGEYISCDVQDPLGRTVAAVYGITAGGTAVIEMAQASGLTLLSEDERDPILTSTYGTGQLILDALERGARDFIMGIGGSATNDGGAGMAQALGYRFYDKYGEDLIRGGGALSGLVRIDASYADPRLRECSFTVACDVENPLLGPDGASAVFGPQKGATPEKVMLLESALARFSACIGQDIAQTSGAGAAGGLGAGCIAFLSAELKKGVDIIIKAAGLIDKIRGSSLVITGEGCTDSQTLGGKTVCGVTCAAKRMDVPVVVISGSLERGAEELLELGVVRLYSIMENDMMVEEAMRNSAVLLKNKAEQAVREFYSFRKG